MSPGLFRTFKSLYIKDYRLLWLGQVTIGMAQWMDQVTRTWLIYDLTHSPLHLGFINAARGLPLLFFGILAGVVADRYGRKLQLVISQTVNALLNIALALLVVTGHVQPWHVYVTGFLAGTVQAFQQPAHQSLVNDLVGEKNLLNAVSLNSAARHLTDSVGAALGGLLIHAFGVGITYFTQAGIFIVATVWTIQIKVPQSTLNLVSNCNDNNQSFIASAREGFSYIISNKLIMVLMLLGLAPALLANPYRSLLPIFATEIFHGGAEVQGLLLMMQGIGAVFGGLAMASLGRDQGNGKLLIGGLMGFSIALIFFSQMPVLFMAAIFTFIAGFFNTSYRTQDQTIIQLIVPGQLRGRVLGIYMLDRGLMPVGSLLAGLLASVLGGPWAITIMGASCLLLAASIAILMPQLWRLNLMPM